jgi:hypothetical protein
MLRASRSRSGLPYVSIPPVSNRLRPLLAGLALVLLVAVTYRGVPDLGMLGWDGWPLVAASRVGSLGELLGTFGEELMDGRYPHGAFYRPVTHLSFALDGWLSGLDVAGYHRTDLALLAGCALCLAALVRRLANGWAGLLAGVVFVLHPIQLELVTVPARRADTLALLFGLACLLAQTDTTRLRRKVAIAALAALAAGSKETGVWVAPAVVGWHWLRPGYSLVPALRASTPALVGVALYVVARTVVLGGLGGHLGEGGSGASTAELWTGLASGALYPEPVFGPTGTPILIAAVALLVAAALVVARQEARAIGFMLVMGLSLLAVTSLADRLHSWYAVLFTAPVAGALSVAAVRGVTLLREGAHARGAAAVGIPLLFLLSFALGSPLVRAYPRLEAADRWLSTSYEALEAELLEAGPGQVIRFEGWPLGVPPLPDGRDVQGVVLAHAYTVNAYLELHHPELPTRVQLLDPRDPARAVDGVLTLELVPGAPPAWVEEASRRLDP